MQTLTLRHTDRKQARLSAACQFTDAALRIALSITFCHSLGCEVPFALPIPIVPHRVVDRRALPRIVQQLGQRSKEETVRGADEERGKTKS